MSSTVRFTPFHPLEHESIAPERNAQSAGVKITDFHGLESELSANLVQQMDTRTYTDRSDYPGKEWKVLLGFTTYGNEGDRTADYHNISNTDVKDISELFATVSQYTNAFKVWVTDFTGKWPHAAELQAANKSIHQITTENGDVEITEITLGVVEQ